MLKIVLFLLLICNAAQSQIYLSVPDSAFFSLDTLKVTATRSEKAIQNVPYAISIIGEQELKSVKKGASLEEVLKFVPGVQVSNRHNLSQGDRISIRGLGSRASFGVRGIKVVLDDIPLTMPDGQTQLNNIDPGSSGQLEIIRGPSSSLYGNASGGVVIIKSPTHPENDFNLSQKVSIGDYGYLKMTSHLSGALNKTQFQANLSMLGSEGFREHSHTQNTLLNVLVKHKLSDKNDITAVFSYFDAPFMLNPSSLAKNDALEYPQMVRIFVKKQGAGKIAKQAQCGVTYNYQQNKTTQIRTTFYGINRSLFNAIPGRVINLERNAGGLRTTVNKKIHLFGNRMNWLVGSDIELQQDKRQEWGNNGIKREYSELDPDQILDNVKNGELQLKQNETVWNRSVFSELETSLTNNMAVTAGLRYDWFSFNADDKFKSSGINYLSKREMKNISPMLSVLYKTSPLTSLYALYSTGFQTPTTTELGNRPDGTGGFNQNLNPEKIQNYEIGFKGFEPTRNIQFSFATYILNITDMLIPYQVSFDSEEIYYRNSGKTQNKGFETAVNWIPVAFFRANLAYTLSQFIFKDYLQEYLIENEIKSKQLSGNKVPGVPNHQLNIGLNFQNRAGFGGGLDFQYTGKYFANDFNGPKTGNSNLEEYINDAFYTVNVDLDYRIEFSNYNVELFVFVDNVLNKQHNRSIVPNAFGNRFFEPAPGRSYFVGMKLGFSTAH